VAVGRLAALYSGVIDWQLEARVTDDEMGGNCWKESTEGLLYCRPTTRRELSLAAQLSRISVACDSHSDNCLIPNFCQWTLPTDSASQAKYQIF
jgi:hypothetical protein